MTAPDHSSPLLVVVPYGLETSGTILFASRLVQVWRSAGINSELLYLGHPEDDFRGLSYSSTDALFRTLKERIEIDNVGGVLWCGLFEDESSRLEQVQVSIEARLRGHRVVLIWERTGVAVNILEPYLLSKLATQGVSAIVALNTDQVRALDAMSVPRGLVHLLSTGVDTRHQFRPSRIGERERLRLKLALPQSARVALWVGRFTARKRPELLIDVWEQFRSHQEALLLMIGSGFQAADSVETKVRERARTIKGLDVRTYHQGLPLRLFYRAADLFVLTGVIEGEPTVLCEAMASGLPIVANAIEGHCRLVKHLETGLLYESDDPNSLQYALNTLIGDATLCSCLGGNARCLAVRERNIEVVAERYLSLLRSESRELHLANKALS
jgi:glycosyltransferase involved in cell wall biosynthesis